MQVIDDSATLKMVDGEPLEFVITREVKHPNVVNTLDFAITNPCRWVKLPTLHFLSPP